jgi:hypothetical protein
MDNSKSMHVQDDRDLVGFFSYKHLELLIVYDNG